MSGTSDQRKSQDNDNSPSTEKTEQLTASTTEMPKESPEFLALTGPSDSSPELEIVESHETPKSSFPKLGSIEKNRQKASNGELLPRSKEVSKKLEETPKRTPEKIRSDDNSDAKEEFMALLTSTMKKVLNESRISIEMGELREKVESCENSSYKIVNLIEPIQTELTKRRVEATRAGEAAMAHGLKSVDLFKDVKISMQSLRTDVYNSNSVNWDHVSDLLERSIQRSDAVLQKLEEVTEQKAEFPGQDPHTIQADNTENITTMPPVRPHQDKGKRQAKQHMHTCIFCPKKNHSSDDCRTVPASIHRRVIAQRMSYCLLCFKPDADVTTGQHQDCADPNKTCSHCVMNRKDTNIFHHEAFCDMLHPLGGLPVKPQYQASGSKQAPGPSNSQGSNKRSQKMPKPNAQQGQQPPQQKQPRFF